MPGIAGIVSSTAERPSVEALERMLKSMAGRMPIARPLTTFAHERFAFGAIGLDHSVAGGGNQTQHLSLFLQGELVSDANRPDATLAERSDIKQFLVGFRKDKRRALLELNGLFSGALFDHDSSTLSIFVDRYGLQRVYVFEKNGFLYFASEAKAILTVCSEARQIDAKGLGEWLSCGCVLQDRTLFKNVFYLPPAAVWSFALNGTVERQQFFSFKDWAALEKFSASEYENHLCDVLPAAIRRCISAETGMSLTGGVDGRMIMAWLNPQPGQIPCYTFNGPYRECADLKIARKVAHSLGQRHDTVQVSEEFLSNFPSLAMDCVVSSDGMMDVSGAVEVYANRLARAIAPVRVTGNYGSEILRRNVAFRPSRHVPSLFSEEIQKSIRVATETYASETLPNTLKFVVEKQMPWHHYARASVERSELRVRSPFVDNQVVRLAFQAPVESYEKIDSSLRVISRGNSALSKIPTDRGATWPASTSARIARVYHEFLARAEYAYDYGMPDWLARTDRWFQALRPERVFLGRQKFCHFRVWYRDHLSCFVKELLLDASTLSRSWWSTQELEQIVHDHISGRRNHTLLLHKAISLELITRHLLSQNA